MDNELIPNNLYEIPKCPICLQEMNESLNSLACGHIFHEGCISQHLKYKGTCPYCQKRVIKKELRTVIYPVQSNTVAGAHLMELLTKIDKSEGKQVQDLLKQIKKLSETSEKLKYEFNDCEKEKERKSKQLQQAKSQLSIKITQCNVLLKQNNNLKKYLSESEKQNTQLRRIQLNLRTELDSYIDQRKQFQYMRRLQKQVFRNSEQLGEYKKNLQTSGKPAQDIINQFYHMLCMKNYHQQKNKEEVKNMRVKVELLNRENEKSKEQIKVLKDKIETILQQKQTMKKKYQTKITKLKNNNEIQEVSDESVSHSVVSSKVMLRVVPAEKQKVFNLVDKSDKNKKLAGPSFGSSLMRKK